MSAQPPVTGVTPEMLAKWRSHQGQGMTSAVGEYTPDEFWLALDEIESLQKRLSEADAELARLRQPMTLMSPCEKHKGMPWSTSGSSVVTGTYVMPRMVCPHCPEAPK